MAAKKHTCQRDEKTKNYINEWDVINESIPESEIMDKCGDALMIEWLKEAKKQYTHGTTWRTCKI